MLKKLELTNFKCHRHLEVDFSDGMNLVVGDNYTGKSTLLHGILYSLFGPSAVPGGAGVVQLRGGGPVEASLQFTANGDTYEVRRKAKSAVLSRNGEEIARSASVVTSHIEGVLGTSMKRFLTLKVAEQKKTESLLTLGAADLHAAIQEISRAEVINNVIDRCSGESTKCRGGLEAIPDSDLIALESGVSELTAALNAEYLQLNTEREAVEKAGSRATTEAIDYQQGQVIEAARVKLRKEHSELLLAIQRERDALVRAEAEYFRLEGMDAAYTAVTDKLARTTTELADLKAEAKRRSDFRSSMQILVGRLADSRNLAAEKQSALETAGDILDTAGYEHILGASKDELAATRREYARLESSLVSGICPTCNRPYSEDEGWRDEVTGQLIEAKKAVDELTGQGTALSAELAAIVESNTNIKRLIDSLGSATTAADQQFKDLEELKETIGEDDEISLQGRVGTLEEKVKQLTDDMRRAHEASVQLAQAEGNRNMARSRIQQYTERWEEIGEIPPPVDFSEQYAQLEKLKTQHTEALALYNGNYSTYTTRTGLLQGLQTQADRAREDHIRRKELSTRLHGCQSLAKYLRGNRDRYLGEVWAGITAYAGEFAGAVTGGAIESLERTEKGEFAYIEKGEEFPVAAASGLQRSVMGLGIQLAMANTLPSPLSTLLLDEPTSDADEARSLAMSSLLASTHDQIIMVSHRQLDGAVANNTIEMGGGE